jgi:ornithine cyclodeaminase
MPSLLQTPEHPALSVKLLTALSDNASRGLPRNQATVILIDATTGQTRAILEGSWLTAVRTGAVSGLATELLALFGAGAQAPTQVWALHTARPLREVRVVNRSAEHYQRLKSTLHQLLGDACPPISRATTASEALKGASLVACATASTVPLFRAQDIAPGTHINAIGAFTPDMCEVDPVTLSHARIVVDQREAALAEAGDLLQALAQGQISGADSWLELGQLVSGEQPGRHSSDEITFFKSVGLGIQDLTMALQVYERARERGVGVTVDL